MITHEEFTKKIFKNTKVQAEYKSLEEEFSLFDELLKARMNTGLTQAEVADRMGTRTPAIARLEAGDGNKKTPLTSLHFESMPRQLETI